ncbi:hypothetical protein KAH55_07215 [bacterium]|nr:hypothetical protein [bacterium]
MQQSTLHDLQTRYALEGTQLNLIKFPQTVGGEYTHAIVNYGRVLEKGRIRIWPASKKVGRKRLIRKKRILHGDG